MTLPNERNLSGPNGWMEPGSHLKEPKYQEDRGLPGLPQGECVRSWLVQGAILRAIEEEEQEKDCREASADSSAQWFPALSV